jgi:hypothetical protein
MSGYRYYTDALGVMHFLCGTDEMTPPARLSSPYNSRVVAEAQLWQSVNVRTPGVSRC